MSLSLDITKLDLRLVDKKIGKENIEELQKLLSFLKQNNLDLSKLVIGGGLAVSILLNFRNLRYQLSRTDIDLMYPESEKLEKILMSYPKKVISTKILDSGKIILGSTEAIANESFLEDARVLKIINQGIELDIIEKWLLATRYVKVPLDEDTIELYTKPLVLKFSETESYNVRIVNEKLAFFTQLLLLSGIAKQDAIRIFRIIDLLELYPELREYSTIQEFFDFCERYMVSKEALIKQYRLMYNVLFQNKWKKYLLRKAPDWYRLFVEELARRKNK